MGTEEFLFEIRKNYRNLRPSEQKVADVILEGTEEIAEYTIEQFAHGKGEPAYSATICQCNGHERV